MYWLCQAIVFLYCIISSHSLSGSVTLSSSNDQKLTLNIDSSAGTVNITLTGKSDAWFGVGFNGTDMNTTYSIVADYDSSTVYELYLGSGFCSPACDKQLTSTITVNSNSVDDGVRTVDITRAITINNAEYYSFPTSASSIPLIWAYGLSEQAFLDGTDMGGGGLTTISVS